MSTISVSKKITLLLFFFLLTATINARPNLVALVGGPGCGKTTLLEALAKKGFKTLSESSTMVIRDERVLGNNEPWKQRELFQRKILNCQLELLTSVKDADGLVFSDRGIPDGIAYFYFDAQEPFNELRSASQNIRYDYVFMLDFLGDYNLDNTIRHEAQDEALKIHALIKKVYEDLGYTLIVVPAMSVEDRISFVLNGLTSRPKHLVQPEMKMPQQVD